MNNRILKEIKSGLESKDFIFIYDENGEYGNPDNCYLIFTVKNNTSVFLGQIHVLEIKFIYGGEKKIIYPINPPNVLFITPIFHTNISREGNICLDVFKGKWSPMYGIETIFNSILALLDDPNTSSPFNSDASKMWSKSNPENYQKYCLEYYKKNLYNDYRIIKLLDNYGEKII